VRVIAFDGPGRPDAAPQILLARASAAAAVEPALARRQRSSRPTTLAMAAFAPPVTDPHRRNQEPTAFDAAVHGGAVDWTPRAVVIDGIPRVIVSAEFHYFRVPDRARWRTVLMSLRAAGFNAVRLYIHWGYHSPAETVLDFTGNRDIGYLLELCTPVCPARPRCEYLLRAFHGAEPGR
jgi:Glycosyl hydrolases family 35